MLLRLPFFSRTKAPFPSATDFGFVELCGGGTRVVIIPALGGKVSALHMGGRQWLWTSDITPCAPGVDGASYVETADTGGFDECFPTVGACRVPGWVRQFGGIELPDHGELWSQVPAVDVRTGSAGQMLHCTWQGLRMPYRFSRAIRVRPDGSVEFEYEVTNDGTERMPFLWSAHPLFPLTASTRLRIPEGSRLRYCTRHGIDLGEPRSEHRWPFIRGGGRVYDFTSPWEVAKRFACKLFVDLTEGEVALREGGAELRVSFDAREVTHLGLWINKRGWTPFREEEPYLNLALEPALGAPDGLVDALGDWKGANWLDAGATRRWSMRLQAGPVVGPEVQAGESSAGAVE